MQKIICVVGPTGVGKTALALDLAEKYNGVLISADSVQVYKKLDIISGKDIPKTTKFVPLPDKTTNGFNTGFFIYNNIYIFLLDVVGPTSSFNVSDFYQLANECIQYAGLQKKLPI